MSNIDIVVLNRKRGNIKGQLIKINKTLAEKKDSVDTAELQTRLYIVLNLQEKFKS